MVSGSVTRGAEETRSGRSALAFAALLTGFAAFGLTLGAQGVLWAPVVAGLNIGMGTFGTVQLAPPLLAIMVLVFGGQLAGWAGMRRLAAASFALLAVSALTLAGSDGLAGLIAALVVLGAGFGLFEVGLNGATLDWEAATGRDALNYMHAGFSAGAVAGALVTGALLDRGWSWPTVCILLAFLNAVVLLVMLAVNFPPASPPGTGTAGPGATIRLILGRRGLIALAAVCVFGAVGESVANLWSVIYVQELGAGMLLGGVTFALLSATMLIGRLLNAPLLGRYGAATSLRLSGIGFVVAAALLVLPGGVGSAVFGFAVLGLATAGVVPTALGAGARLAPGQSGAIAGGLLTAVYFSFMVSPPLIGWLTELASLGAALLIVGASGVALLLLSGGVAAE